MTTDVAEILRTRLVPYVHSDGNPSGFISNLAGLTRITTNYSSDDEGNAIITKFPYPVLITGNAPAMTELVPDSKKRCIIYFTGKDATPVNRLTPDMMEYQVNLGLVCWFNTLGFQAPFVTAKLIAAISGIVGRGHLPYQGVITSMRVKERNVTESNPAIFTGLTYTDRNGDYLATPYGYFQLNYAINIVLHEASTCVPALIPLDLPVDC